MIKPFYVIVILGILTILFTMNCTKSENYAINSGDSTPVHHPIKSVYAYNTIYGGFQTYLVPDSDPHFVDGKPARMIITKNNFGINGPIIIPGIWSAGSNVNTMGLLLPNNIPNANANFFIKNAGTGTTLVTGYITQ